MRRRPELDDRRRSRSQYLSVPVSSGGERSYPREKVGTLVGLPEAVAPVYALLANRGGRVDHERFALLDRLHRPCHVYHNPAAGRIYQRLGFIEIGNWQVIDLHADA